MTQVSETIRRHHSALRRTLRAHLKTVRSGSDPGEREALVEFLVEELIPHAQGEELAFYPVMDELLRDHGTPTRTMSLDHERILSYVARLSRATRHRIRGKEVRSGARDATFDRLALELGALLELHFDKENRAYLPLFARLVSPEKQTGVLARMHEGAEHGPGRRQHPTRA
jgi:hemerythrin-like domain-containing protein